MKLFRRWKASKPHGHIDAVAGRRISGWACSRRGPVTIEALVGSAVVAEARPSVERSDVARAFPGIAHAGMSGFRLTIPESAASGTGLTEVRLRARETGGSQQSLELGRFRLASPQTVARVAQAPDSGIAGPFPREVIDAVAVLWPEDCANLATPAGQARFAGRVQEMARTPGLASLPAIANYCRYLRACWAHCRFVDDHFPAENASAGNDGADFHCKPNSVRELFSIVHQLYVLKSWGVKGAFGEFGCFKGFSTSMLSFAARQLHIPMHVFDSFEGLPPSDSTGYAAGDYAGSLDEVTDHVRRFGAPEMVTFHKGFFADTFRTFRPPTLMCLWMDVDLEVSARDLMVVADRLHPQATLFSHECEPGLFAADGTIVAQPHPDNPIPPVLARHEQLGRPLTGRFLAGNTGALWPREGGIPAMDSAVLAEMMAGLA